MSSLSIVLYTTLFLVSWPLKAYCFVEAGGKNKIDPLLLKAIAIQESNLNHRAVNTTGNKMKPSKDFGLMQINSQHILHLKREGLIKSELDLLNNPCLNVKVGAGILARHFRVCGRNWDCVGSYNAGFSKKRRLSRARYSSKIRRIYTALLKEKKLRGARSSKI